MALTGLKIETNIPNITGEFDNLIAHINDKLAKPFNMDFNIGQVQEQIQKVTDSVVKMQEQINQISSNNKPILNSAQTIEEATKIGQTVTQIKDQLSSLGNVSIKYTSFDETNKQFDKIIATVKSADGVVKQFNADISGMFGKEVLYNNLAPKSVTDNTQNTQYQEANNLLQQQYKYQTDINVAKAKGYETTLNDLQAKKQEIDLQLTQAKSDLTDNQLVKLKQQEISLQDKLDQQLNNQVDKQTQINSKVEQEVAKFKELSNIKLQNLETTMSGASGKGVDVSAIKDEVASLKELAGTMNSTNFSQVQSQWNTQLKQTQANLKSITQEAKNQHGAFSSLIHDGTEMLKWSLSGGFIFGLVNGFKDAITYANQLNTSMTNIEMITDMSAQKASGLVEQYRQLAGSMGQNDTDFLKGAEEYLRAGLSDQDTTTMLKQNAMASAISGVDNQTMSENLIAMKNAYGLTADQVGSLVDKISTLDNKSSASFEGISEGMKRSAASAQEVGVQYDKLASYITTVEDVTHKSASTIGENFKTIFSRLTNVAAGQSEDGTNINDVEKVLSKQNIAIRESAGQWQNMGDVIDSIGSKWNTFDGVTKSQIATVVAGKQQVTTFLALMQNMTKEKQLEADATASQGSAEQKYQTYLQSTTSKINTLTVSLHTMFSEMVNSNQINGVVGGLQSMVNMISNAVKQFGILPVAMTAIIPILSQINDKFAMLKIGFNDSGNIQFTGLLANGFKNLKSSVDNYSTSYAKYIQQLTIARGEEYIQPSLYSKISASFLAMGDAAAISAIKTAALTAANIALNAAIGFGLGIAITGLIGLFTSWANKIKDTQTDIDSLASKMNELKQNDQLISQYENLSNQLQSTSKNSTDYKNIQGQVLDIQKQLAQQFPSLIDGYDAQGNALVKNIDKLKEYNNQQKLMIQASASSDYTTMLGKITQKSGPATGAVMGNIGLSEIEEYNKYIKLLDEEMKTTGKDTQGYANKIKDASSHIQSFNENAVKLYSIGQTNVQYFDTATGKLVKYSDYIKQNQQNTQGATNTTNSNTSALGNNTSATNANSNAKNANGKSAGSAANQNQSLGNVMTDLSDSMSKAQTNLTDINQLLDKHKTSGEWDYATILKLANNGYPALISAMGDDKKMTDILLQAKQDEVNTAENSLKKQIDLEKDKVNSVLVAYGLDVSNFNSSEQAKTAILQAEVNKRLVLLQNEAKAYSDNANAQLDKANADGDEVASQKAAQFYQRDLNQAKKIQSQIDGLKSGNLAKADPTLNDDVNNYFNLKKLQAAATQALNGVGSTSDDGKKNSTSNSANKQANAQLTAQSRDVANQSRNIAIQSRNLDMQTQTITNQENALDNQSRTLTNQSTALENQSKILDIQKQEQETAMENAQKSEQQHLDDIIKGYNNELDALKAKKDVQDETNQALDYQNKLIKDQQDLNNAQNQKVRVFMDGQWTYQSDTSKVSSARDTLSKDQEDYRRWQADQAEKKQEDSISAKIKSTQDQKDTSARNYNNQKDALDQSYQKQQNNIDMQKMNIQNQQTNISNEKANLDQQKQNIQNQKTNLDNAKNDVANQQNSINDSRNSLAGYADGTDNADSGTKWVKVCSATKKFVA
jgi:TP901 family phage tail tape measure protein